MLTKIKIDFKIMTSKKSLTIFPFFQNISLYRKWKILFDFEKDFLQFSSFTNKKDFRNIPKSFHLFKEAHQ